MNNIKTRSTITCPACGFQRNEVMPVNSCQYFWQCPDCNDLIKPKKADCCVYCSYGDVNCPPVQQDRSCC
ncbi:GDCCVxC domain-containing (seleno)protein [Gracilimonas sp. Q87]|uniref:GDCCVxC domain-containing (seleno)protein n=1 Tax=Gracilimonas sp. Q87 TaxID=3384766 RepID=UPI0039841081